VPFLSETRGFGSAGGKENSPAFPPPTRPRSASNGRFRRLGGKDWPAPQGIVHAPFPALRFMKPLLFFLLSAAALAQPEDFRFRYEVLATGMPQPMTMQMAPDGRIFFHEIAGKLRLLDPATREVKEVGHIEVTTAQENGLLGMALDPAFAQNGWIYLMHSPKDYDGQVVSRFTVKDDRLDMASRKDLLSFPEQRRECCHHAGAMRFGPDGNLYISTGDNTNPFGSDGFTPIDQRPDRDPWDAQKSSANTNDLRGKILRIRPTPEGAYTVPEGNLFPVGMAKTRPEIFAMGFRNPWRFQVDPKTGIVYAGDVGPDAGGDKDDRGPNGYDTINQIRQAAFLGWPYSRGKKVYRDYDFEAASPGAAFDPRQPINDSPNNTGLRELPPVSPPMIWYASRASEEFPLLGTGGRTACAGPVFHYDPKFETTDGFPEHYDRSLLIYDWQRPFIHWARLDGGQNLTGLEPFTASARVAQGDSDGSERFQIKRPVDMFFGPDGCLYLADYGETWGSNQDSRIVKISYQRGNIAPVAKAAGENTAGREPLTVKLSAQGSRDPEGRPLQYGWRIGGKLVAEGVDAEITLDTPGDFSAELTVTDDQGATATAAVPLTVGNTPPTVVFKSPRDGGFFTPGEPILYEVEIDDAEDGHSRDGAKSAQISAATLLTAEWVGADGKKAETAVGLTLMKQSTCFNCHAVDQPLLGPPLVAIADKYRGQAGALETSVDRVLHGSTGIWGQVPMLPHPQHSKDELHMMVSWIYSLQEGKTGPAITRGLTGTLQPPQDEKTRSGTLEASFTDFGRSPASPLTGRASITLRQRTVEAESADEIHGPKKLGFGNASGKNGIGAINHGHRIVLHHIDLGSTGSITCRVASAGAGGTIELRAGTADGELLGTLEVQPTGDWDTWVEHTLPIQTSLSTTDLHATFTHPKQAGGLMNLDWIRFNAK
jgi:cytochrome c